MTSVQAPRKKRRVSTVTASANTALDQTISGDETNTGDSNRKIRTSTACRVCRKRKVRCQPGRMSNEGEIGPCSYCVGIDQPGECSYAPPKDRAAFSREYVSKLEKRMALMERQLDKIQPLLDAFHNGSLLLNPSDPLPSPTSRPRPIALPTQNATGYSPPSLSQKFSVQVDPMDRQDSDTASEGSSSPPLRAHRPSLADQEYGLSLYDENGKPRWIGSHNTFSILDAVSRNHHTTTSRPTTAYETLAPKPLQQQWALYAGPLAETPRRPEPTFTLPTESLTFPSKEYAHQLYEAYFEHLYPIMPIMSIRRAREGLEKVFLEKESLDRIPNEQGDASLATCFAILAIGERILADRAIWSEKKDGQRDLRGPPAGVLWFETAYHLQHLGSRNVDHFQVQCLTLLAAYQACANRMPQAWLLAGQAVRYAMDMGYHRPTVQREATPHNRQIRRRMWWTIYGMERLLSLSLGRPSAVDDHDIDCPLPAAIGEEHILQLSLPDAVDPDPNNVHEPVDGTISGLIALTKLCRIVGKVSHLLHRRTRLSEAKNAEAIAHLDHALDKWFSADLPQKFKDPSPYPAIQQMSAVLSNTYFTVLIALHRHCLLRQNVTSTQPNNAASLSKCVDTARSMIRVVARRRILITPSHHLSIMCQYLWSSGTILLLYIKHCTESQQSLANIDQLRQDVQLCRISLDQLSCVWPGADKLRQLLDDVEEVCVNIVDRSTTRVSHLEAPSTQTTQIHPDFNTSTSANMAIDHLPEIPENLNDSEWELPRETYQMPLLPNMSEISTEYNTLLPPSNVDILDFSTALFGIPNAVQEDTGPESSFPLMDGDGELRGLFSGVDFDGDAFWGLFGNARQ